jgi:chorismate-pyruvate lyase
MIEPWIDLQRPETFFTHLDVGSCPPYSPITPEHLTAEERFLLDHQGHMTTTLEAFYGHTVRLEVLDCWEQSRWYSRAVLLHLAPFFRPVQFGVVVLELSALPAEIQQAIRRRQAPIGRLLMRYDPLRTVRIHGLWHFDLQEQWWDWFRLQEPCPFAGRTACLSCASGPVAYLLEVVTPPPLVFASRTEV